jgi:hypothetical protein
VYFALTETSINISIGNKPLAEYMAAVAEQIRTGQLTLGEITDAADLERNLAENGIPAKLSSVTASSYREFLAERRKPMAEMIRRYFDQLEVAQSGPAGSRRRGLGARPRISGP